MRSRLNKSIGNTPAMVASAQFVVATVGVEAAVWPQASAESWKRGVSGVWGKGANWTPGGVPNAATDVTIAASGAYTVTINSKAAAHSITLDASGATVTNSSPLQLGGLFDIEAGRFVAVSSVQGGTISVGGAGDFSSIDGTLSGVVFQGTLDMSAQGAYLVLTDGTRFADPGGAGGTTIDMTGSGGQLIESGSGTLDNAVIDIGAYLPGISGFTGATLFNSGVGATLTLGPRLIVDQANIYAALNDEQGGAAIINEGIINANIAGGFLEIDATGFSNNGVISLTNGDTIDLMGNISATLIDSIQVVDGTMLLSGNVTGGTIVAPGGDVVPWSGTLAGVTVLGTLTVGTDFVPDTSSSGATITNGIIFAGDNGTGAGTLDFLTAGPQYSSSGSLTIVGDQTWNNVTINIGYYGAIYSGPAQGNSATLTLDAGVVINHTNGQARLEADNLVNYGVINAMLAGGDLMLYTESIVNDGTINLGNGDTLDVMGNGTSGFVSSINNTGGTLYLESAYVGTSSVTVAAGAELFLAGGGTLSASITGAGTLLLGTSLGYSFTAGAAVGVASVDLLGSFITLSAGVGIDLAAGETWSIGNASVQGGAGSFFSNGSTVAVSLGGATFSVDFIDSGVVTVAAGASLTLGFDNANASISGTVTGAGTLAVDGTAGLTIAQGAVLSVANVLQDGGPVGLGNGVALTWSAGQTWTIGNAALSGGKGSSFTNAGTFATAGAGVSDVTVAFINSGVVNVDTGSLQFIGKLTNTGTITVAGADLGLGKTLLGNGQIDIGNAGSLDVQAFGPAQTIDFLTSSGVLSVDRPLLAEGHIAGFSVGDTIDLANTTETSFVYAKGLLTVFDRSAVIAKLHFSGDYTMQSFDVTNDGHGNTIITHA